MEPYQQMRKEKQKFRKRQERMKNTVKIKDKQNKPLRKFFYLVIFILLILNVTAEPFKVNLGTPKIVFRSEGNNTLFVGDIVTIYLDVKNKNNFPINILFIPDKELDIDFGKNNFSLSAGARQSILTMIKLKKGGNYSSSIAVQYTTDETNITPNKFILQSNLVFVDVKDNRINYLFIFAWSLIIITLLVIFYLNFLRDRFKQKII